MVGDVPYLTKKGCLQSSVSQTGEKLNNSVDWTKWVLSEKPSIKKQIKRWLKSVKKEYGEASVVRCNDRCQMEVDGIKLLMRCYTNDVDGLCLVIASVYLDRSLQNQGWFKSFLQHCIHINPWDKLVIEDVENSHLLAFCIESGFYRVSERYSTSFVVAADMVGEFEVGAFNS